MKTRSMLTSVAAFSVLMTCSAFAATVTQGPAQNPSYNSKSNHSMAQQGERHQTTQPLSTPGTGQHQSINSPYSSKPSHSMTQQGERNQNN
ncbi:hypothetical protein AiwAL_02240 [Acidiphilium sp. AL]|uniref:Lipoprotein n=1 Tax=Acidiphilium iwatense TaxID=768198 RepID=A0ABS9DRR8_9PROT|nr:MULTISPECIES: hypothetical protein [Acidiphilium]MCF3945407.1 hypothetical protein [Acidiphilium iwatense]MCU4158923.1 hypothetical protein [Acidiphilium sp. AL]